MSFGPLEPELDLTETEAIAFLKYTLRIDDVENKLKGPKLDLLQEFTRTFHEQIPFQNLSLLVSVKERHLPTVEEIKSDCFSGIGGMCYTSAIFGQRLLKTLGFDCFLIAVNVPSTEKDYTHVAFVVKDACFPGHRFLIDLGAGYPTLEPVPLHLLPLYYKQTFLEYKFIRQDNGLIGRYHKAGNHHFQLGRTFNPVGDDGWQKYYEFEEIRRDELFIKKHLRPIYMVCGYGAPWLTSGLKMSIYPSATEAYTVSDSELKKWYEGKNTEAILLETLRDLKVTIQNHFPTLVDINLHNLMQSYKEDRKNSNSKSNENKNSNSKSYENKKFLF